MRWQGAHVAGGKANEELLLLSTPKCRPQQDKINKDMTKGSGQREREKERESEEEQSANWPVQLIIQVKIFISCDTYKISQVTVVAPFDSCLTLPQMTAPK